MNRKHKWSAFLAIAMICGSITGCAGTENNSRETVQNSSSIKEESQKSDDKYSDTITLVWYPNESAEDYLEAIRLVEEEKIKLRPLMTKTFCFKDYLQAYQYIDENRETAMKILIDVQA